MSEKMSEKKLNKLLTALLRLIEKTTEYLEVETDVSRQRLKDWLRMEDEFDLDMNEDDDSSWPDEFEDDWK